MIKNEKQYNITKRKIGECNEAIDSINNNPEKHPSGKIMLTTSLEVRQMAELLSLLTDYKIRAGLTQKEFAKKLGLKEQQLQRYEASSFKSVTFKNLIKYFDILGLEIRIKQTRITKTNKKTAKKKKHA